MGNANGYLMALGLNSDHHHHGDKSSDMELWWSTPLTSWRVWVLSLSLLYVAYQKHCLPDSVARVVGRVYFYPTWPFTYLARRKDYWSLVDSHVLLGAAPMSFMGHTEALHKRGVRAVVNLCDEYSGPLYQYKKLHIAQLHLPTIVRPVPPRLRLGVRIARTDLVLTMSFCLSFGVTRSGPHGAVVGRH